MKDDLVTKESAWDYPRPPRLESTSRRIRVIHAGVIIADTTRALRILETSHPPVYYVPRSDLRMELLKAIQGNRTFCEFKGDATYWDIHLPAAAAETGRVVVAAAWSYESPAKQYAKLAHHLAFYASRVDECWVDAERVIPQPGDFYGGWITSDIAGPFKGSPGTLGW